MATKKEKSISEKNQRKESSEVALEEDAEGAFAFSQDPLVNEVQRQVIGVFEVFDQSNQKTVDVREVGTMCRALDLCPTEADVHEIIGSVEESSTKGLVRKNTFVNHMTKVICEGKYKPVLFDNIMTAFREFDRDKKGTIDPPRFKQVLMTEGEPFTADEVEEMFNFAVTKSDGLIHWEEYVGKLYQGFGSRR